MKNMTAKKFRISLFFCFLLIANIASASFHKNLWPKWQVNNPLSTAVITHQEWQAFLDRNIVINKEGINMVDYSNISEADTTLLKQYIIRMSQVPISNYNRAEQLAFWLNVYNALTVQTVMHYYPISCIQEINISPGLFSVGPWGANLIKIDGTRLSLDEIHNRIIRPVWNDPRTHYAINNGTIGAANLSKQAFLGVTLEQQLNLAASNYINSLRGTHFIEGKLVVSKVYEWFTEDFGGNENDLIKHLAQFAKEPLRSQLKHVNAIDSYTYNWHINSTVPQAA